MTKNTCSKAIKVIGVFMMLSSIYISFLLSGFLEKNIVFDISALSYPIYEKCNTKVAVIGILLSVFVGCVCIVLSKISKKQNIIKE